MKKHRFAFVDLETTGLDPRHHEIIEIGLIVTKRWPDYEVEEEWEVKVKPEHLESAEPEALRINGYNDAEWLFAVPLKQAMEIFAAKTKDTIMVAQNVSFDWSFLAQAFHSTGVKNQMHYHRLDLISLAYARLYNDPKIERFNLASLASHFGLKNERAHTALADIRLSYQVFRRLFNL